MTARLHEDDVRRIAAEVVRQLAPMLVEVATTAAREAPEQLVDAATVARALGVTADTVRANAERLGGRRIGDGPRGRWRFVLAEAVEAWTARTGGRGSPPPTSPVAAPMPRARRRAAPAPSGRLLPVRGDAMVSASRSSSGPAARERPGPGDGEHGSAATRTLPASSGRASAAARARASAATTQGGTRART
jgi:hypothetical protein